MLNQLQTIAKTAASFLQQGVAPPNTPENLKEKLSEKNHLASKKFFLAFSGFIILAVFFVFSVGLLYSMINYPVILPSYTLIFTKTIEVFAVIMVVYLGGQAAVDLKYNSSSSTENVTSTENINSYQKIDITETVAIEKEDDYTLEVEE
jgi:hypothetical protein